MEQNPLKTQALSHFRELTLTSFRYEKSFKYVILICNAIESMIENRQFDLAISTIKSIESQSTENLVKLFKK